MRILSLLVLAGCAPTASLQLNYAIDQPEWRCQQPQLRAEVGLESKSRFEIGLYHESMVRCGKPFNDKFELVEDGLYVRKTWGGYQ